LFTVTVQAEYVSERLYLGIYELPDSTTTPVKMLPTGTEVEVLETQGDFVRIRAGDGSEGWARTEFISDKTPASLVLKQVTKQRDQLQVQLNAIGVTEQTVKRLQRQLAEANNTIKNLRRDVEGEQTAAAEMAAQQKEARENLTSELNQKLEQADAELLKAQEEIKLLKTRLREAGGTSEDTLVKIAWLLFSMALSLVIGAIIGAQWLSRKVRKRFAGRKVW
jgi:SH3 domain protein